MSAMHGVTRVTRAFIFTSASVVFCACAGGVAGESLVKSSTVQRFETIRDTKALFNSIYQFSLGIDAGNVVKPYAGLYANANGDLYGVTETPQGTGTYGAIYELDQKKNATETTLYTFKGDSTGDGEYPKGELIADTSGVLYGTTARGGGDGCKKTGCGTVFSLQPSGTSYKETVLHSFAGGATDGAQPYSGLVETNGMLYGTTSNGGPNDLGSIFTVSPAGTGYAPLYFFTGGAVDGGTPNGTLVAENGTLYGTAASGGANSAGTLYSLVPGAAAPVVLHSFGYQGQGAAPEGGVVYSGGLLFGTTSQGGTSGAGTVYSYNLSTGAYTDIYDFKGQAAGDGADSWSPLTLGPKGSLYGTTLEGGTGPCISNSVVVGCGTLFELSPKGSTYSETELYSFKGPDSGDGQFPYAGLTPGKHGFLYGVTFNGGSSGSECVNGCGMVFRWKP
jgi:uncharacterized repeat protein (TIGR03803 family)